MRVVVLALLLANILFFGWQYWLGRHEPPVLQDPYRDVPELELASALAPVSVVVTGEESTAGFVAGGAASNGACATLGPFADKTQAETAIGGSGLSEFQPVLREVSSVRTTYWVYLPPFRDRQSANRALRTLSEIGINDAYVVGDGEDRNAIALGLYSDQERATRRADQVKALGVTAQIGPLRRVITQYVIDLVLPSLGVLDAGQIGNLGSGVSMVEMNCDAPVEGLLNE
ncbi:MAG: SPOR domain-containing protein [Gammaproteobacteria bacterium]|nr:SPOR domain-containing protein [Gammaproteobacteria bacterium]